MLTLQTPIGPITAPPGEEARVRKMSDAELLQNLYEGGFIDPCVYAEIQRRMNPIRREWALDFYDLRQSAINKYLGGAQC
jgi:hypothetical protein